MLSCPKLLDNLFYGFFERVIAYGKLIRECDEQSAVVRSSTTCRKEEVTAQSTVCFPFLAESLCNCRFSRSCGASDPQQFGPIARLGRPFIGAAERRLSGSWEALGDRVITIGVVPRILGSGFT